MSFSFSMTFGAFVGEVSLVILFGCLACWTKTMFEVMPILSLQDGDFKSWCSFLKLPIKNFPTDSSKSSIKQKSIINQIGIFLEFSRFFSHFFHYNSTKFFGKYEKLSIHHKIKRKEKLNLAENFSFFFSLFFSGIKIYSLWNFWITLHKYLWNI